METHIHNHHMFHGFGDGSKFGCWVSKLMDWFCTVDLLSFEWPNPDFWWFLQLNNLSLRPNFVCVSSRICSCFQSWHPHLFSGFSFFGVKIDLQLIFSTCFQHPSVNRTWLAGTNQKKGDVNGTIPLNDRFSTRFPESSIYYIYLHNFHTFPLYFQNLHFQQTRFPTANWPCLARRRPLVRAQERGPGGAERSRRGAPWQFQKSWRLGEETIDGSYPLVMTNIAIEKWPFIVDIHGIFIVIQWDIDGS